MTRWSLCAAVAALACVTSCGGSKDPAKNAEGEPGASGDTTSASSDSDAASPDPSGPPVAGTEDDAKGDGGANPCTGFEMDLMAALIQSACEVPNAKPDDKLRDVKNALQVTVNGDSARVAPGGHLSLVVTFTNKSTGPLPLDFQIDPMPRFQIEIYNAKSNKRVDLPPGKQPKVPAGMASREPGTPSTARVTLVANGKGWVRLGWDATRMRWAPEKLKGTPPEQGFPRVPAGPLPKGKYAIRVVTPLIGVFEGVDHELSAPRTSVDVQ